MNKHTKVDPKDLLIIITTSPVQSNPSTEVIDLAIDSIKAEPSLDGVPIVIICDGVKVTQENVNKFKSGIVSKQALEKYQQFKQTLKAKHQNDETITIIERVQRYCFAQNIKYVMLQAQQPFVLIFQHDHTLLRKIDFTLIVDTMKQHPINYIGLMNKSVNKLSFTLDQNMNLRKHFSTLLGYQQLTKKWDHQLFVKDVVEYYQKLYGLPLMPLIFWYDKVHVARRSFYLEVIFNKKGYFDQIKQEYSKVVSFVQDAYGTTTMRNIRQRPSKFAEVNSFILWDRPQHAIRHIHGRAFLTQEQREQMFIKHIKQKESSSQDEKMEPQEEQFHHIDLFQEREN